MERTITPDMWNELGLSFQNGEGRDKDEKKAFQCYRFKKAAEQGDENAIYNLEALGFKRCPSCNKWDTIDNQSTQDGKADMLVCMNEQCPDHYFVYAFDSATGIRGKLISGKECPWCGQIRSPLNSGAWVCYNDMCSEYKKIDRRF